VKLSRARKAFGYEEISEARGGLKEWRIFAHGRHEPGSGMPCRSAHSHESVMRKPNLAIMPFEDLWQLYEELAKVLADRISARKGELEDRLARLNSFDIVREVRTSPRLSPSSTDRALRPKYPEVLPKYRNPVAPSQKWSGRGKRPKWVIAALEAGQTLDDLRIEPAPRSSRKSRPRGRRA